MLELLTVDLVCYDAPFFSVWPRSGGSRAAVDLCGDVCPAWDSHPVELFLCSLSFRTNTVCSSNMTIIKHVTDLAHSRGDASVRCVRVREAHQHGPPMVVVPCLGRTFPVRVGGGSRI